MYLISFDCVLFIATKTENQAGEVKKAPGENEAVFLSREIFLIE